MRIRFRVKPTVKLILIVFRSITFLTFILIVITSSMLEKSPAQNKMADEGRNLDNYILVINCSKCLSSEDFITRKHTGK